jgi:hypothetical protein
MHEQRSPREQAERVPLPRWVPPLLAVVAFALVPWTLWLTSVLPTRHVTHNYRGAWVGFDVGMAIAFAVTAIAAVRFSRWLPIAASVTGTLLVCDAWFDVVTAGPGNERVVAAAEAFGGELPLAALCAWIVWDVQRFEASLIYRYARRFRRADLRLEPEEGERTPA